MMAFLAANWIIPLAIFAIFINILFAWIIPVGTPRHIAWMRRYSFFGIAFCVGIIAGKVWSIIFPV